MMKIPMKIMIPEIFFSCIWISVSLEKFGFHKPNYLIIVDRNHFWPAGSVTLRFQEMKKLLIPQLLFWIHCNLTFLDLSE